MKSVGQAHAASGFGREVFDKRQMIAVEFTFCALSEKPSMCVTTVYLPAGTFVNSYAPFASVSTLRRD